MTPLQHHRTGLLSLDLENYVAHEREIGVWSFPHFVRYLRGIIYKLTPQPHHCSLAVLDAAADILAKGEPGVMTQLMSNPPSNHRSPARVAREAANAIVEVIGHWAGWDGHVKLRGDDYITAAERAYERAKAAVRQIESKALDVGLTVSDLMACAVDANSDQVVSADRRDAALAAFSAGHFRLGHEIATGIDEKS